MAGDRVTAGQLRSVPAGGRVARPPAFSDRQKLNEKAAPGLGRKPFSLYKFASRKGLTVSLPLFRGELCKGRNDPSRQLRLASCNYSFGQATGALPRVRIQLPPPSSLSDFSRARESLEIIDGFLEVAHIVGIFNYLTRLADGFGLELHPALVEAARGGIPLRARWQLAEASAFP